MKKTLYLVFIIYIIIFTAAIGIFYWKMRQKITSSAAPAEPINTPTTANYIYFSEGTTFYRADKELAIASLPQEEVPNDTQMDNHNITLTEGHLWRTANDGLTKTQIDDLSLPKKVSGFSSDQTGKKIVYSVTDESLSNIYLVNRDGSNRLQITNDGKATNPIFSPDGQEIAFERPDGIHIYSILYGQEKKSISVTGTFKLLLWK